MVYSSFYRRAFTLATALILGYLLFRLLRPLASTLGWAAVLAFMLHPLHDKLTRRLHGNATMSASLLTGLTPFCVLAPLSFLGVMFTAQAATLIGFVRNRSWLHYSEVLDQMARWPVLGPMVTWGRDNVVVSAEQVQAWVNDSMQTVLRSAASLGGNLVFGVFGTLVSFFVMLFLLFFFLREGRTILNHLTRLIPIEPGTRFRMLAYLGDVVRAVVFGSSATALICGAFVGVGFAIVGLPSPLVFGVLGVIAALLPAGAGVLLIPPIIYLLIERRWGAATFLALWTAAMWLVESIVRPVLTAHRADVSTLAIFIGAIGGVSAFGLLGLVIGPVLLSFAVALLLFAEATVSREHNMVAASARPWQGAPPLSRGSHGPAEQGPPAPDATEPVPSRPGAARVSEEPPVAEPPGR